MTHTLYPPIEPFETRYLKRPGPAGGRGVELYYEQSGRKDGEPVLFLHGGPGSGSGPERRRHFDPAHYRFIQFDQRGAGASRPHAMLEGNTTQALIEDMEALRAHLGVERWALFGGSWGSTLALAYAQAHPDAVSHICITGVFLGEADEIAFWYSPWGAPRFHPRAWRELIAPAPDKYRSDWRSLVGWYLDEMREEADSGRYEAIDFSDPKTRVAQSRDSRIVGWTVYEQVLSNYARTPEQARAIICSLTPGYIKAHSLIEAWYFSQDCFLEPGQILRDMPKIADIPMTILQGRLDMVCPPRSAQLVHDAHPDATIRYSVRHGHIMRGDMKRQVTQAFDAWARR